MNSLLLKIINPIVLLLVINQFATGFKPRLYGPNTFRFTHKRMAIVLLLALAAHLGLNSAWVRHTYFRRKPKPKQRAAPVKPQPAVLPDRSAQLK